MTEGQRIARNWRDHLRATLGREPTYREIGKVMSLPPTAVDYLLREEE